MSTPARADEEATLPVTFSGGHDTAGRDRGRPVVLIAGALGVEPEVFREAFRGVTPSRNGPPSREEARRNKAALMRVLGPLGVTNDRLDEVSNYYRYQPQEGELWPTTAAEAHAVVENGEVVRIVVTNPGSGYSSPPAATVDGHANLRLTARLEYGADFGRNGAIMAVEMVE